jgi:Flp pilus assembly protein TadD
MDKDNPILIALTAARTAFRAGDQPNALAACLTVLEHVPNHPLAHLMAGLLQQQAEEYGKAIRHLRFAVAHDPNDMEIRDALGMCLLATGRHAEALPHLRQVVAAVPDNTNARYNLGRCLLDLHNFVEAERVYEAHVERNPGDAEAFNHLGLARLAKGNNGGAEACFRTAIKLNHTDPIFHMNLAQALLHGGKMGEAGTSYLTAIDLNPVCPNLRAHHGWFLLGEGQLDWSEDRFREALQRAPEDESASAGLAAVLERRDEATVGFQVLRPFISSVHPHPKVALSYATLSRVESVPEQALPVLRRAIRPGVPKYTEAALRFAEGDLLDAMGDVDAAFDAYQRANTAQGTRYDASAHKEFVDSLIEVFTPELFASLPKPTVDTSSSVLVVGMPRSGISLVERILASHSEVCGAGELDDLSVIASGIGHFVNAEGDYPALVKHMDSALIQELAEGRMESLSRVSNLPVVMDKMAHNFLHLGLAAILTPGAKVIHVVRDPLDTCLSCYFQHFGAQETRFTTQLSALKGYFVQYHRLMKHWGSVLPNSMKTVRYEDIVADAVMSTKDLLGFLERGWEHGEIDFDGVARVVGAVASGQARDSSFSSSVGRAERYRHRIGELVSLAQLGI